MTKIIEKLNRRDLVNIIPNGRTKQIYLSDKGKDLAEILCIAPPSLSKIVYKLAQQELVTITKDGRIKHIYITDKGRELVPEILQIFNETREKFMEMNQDYNLSGFIKDVNYLREKIK